MAAKARRTRKAVVAPSAPVAGDKATTIASAAEVGVMATAVDAAIVEIMAALEEMALAHEGLRDYAVLDIQPATALVISNRIDDFNRRDSLLRSALAACEALVADGYPGLEVEDVAAAVYADLQAQRDSIEAAPARFSPTETAAALGLSAGEGEPK